MFTNLSRIAKALENIAEQLRLLRLIYAEQSKQQEELLQLSKQSISDKNDKAEKLLDNMMKTFTGGQSK